MIDIPVSGSPLSMVWIIGDAPLHLGNRLGCIFNIPLERIRVSFNSLFINLPY